MADMAKPAGNEQVKVVVDGEEETHQISHGLTSQEAAEALKKWGPNELPEKKTPSWMIFLLQMKAPMPIMIWLAIIVELAIGNYPDAGILLLIQMTNSTIGWYETVKSGNAVAALKAGLKPEATVKRDGKFISMNATQIVPGDCVLLASGSAIPADCLVNEGNIDVDQSGLTGESLPVKMKGGSLPKMGSTVVRGEVEGTVLYTGVNTFFGKTADLLNTNKGMDHLQKILLKIVIILTGISILLCGTAFIYLIVKFGDFRDAVEFSVVVLVASIPLAMEIVVTTTLALGSRQLAADGAIVTRLSAIEDLSGMNILCSDKTGTLTLNEMKIQPDTPTFMPGYDQNKLLVLAALAAKWKEPPRDALDTLVLTSADLKVCDTYEQPDFTPFDPATKRTAATVKGPDGVTFDVTKGAPQVILNLCSAANKAKVGDVVNDKVTDLGRRGIRSLAVARNQSTGGDFEFVGILSFLDPPRPDSRDTIMRAHERGIDVKMITGDQQLIAKETARQLAMGDNILDPKDLPDFQVGGEVPKDLGKKYGTLCYNADGFAQVYPEHKFLIIESLRQSGFAVGMTGDGVNDAPALKRADVGVAVQGATDAARAAADIVLTQPGLSTIILGIEVARTIFQRMQNFLTYRIAATLQLVFFFIIALFALEPRTFQDDYPDFFFIPVILLMLITFLNDGTMIAIGYDNVKPVARPAKWNLAVLFSVASVLAAVSCFSALLLLYLTLDSCTVDANGTNTSFFSDIGLPCVDYPKIVMMMYMKVAVGDFLTLFAARTGDRPFYSSMPAAILVAGAGLSLVITTLLASLWPTGRFEGEDLQGLARGSYGLWPLWVWVYSIVWFLIQDALKILTFWVIRKLDLFHAVSGQMVAVRDVHTFEDPVAAQAAGVTEQKYLDYAIAAGAEEAAKLARTSGGGAGSSNLRRMSQVMAGAAPRPTLGRTSIINAGKPGSGAMDVDRMQADFEAAASTLKEDDRARMAPHLLRVSQGADNLRRVSQAYGLQRKSMAPNVDSTIKENV